MEGNERLTDGELAEIRKRAEAATAGPWHVSKHCANEIRQPQSARSRKFSTCCDHDGFLDAEFIAKSRQDVPKLLAEIERLRTDQERLISELKKADQISEGLERKYMAAKWPEVMADINEYVARKRRERDD